MSNGTVKWFNQAKGFGFIQPDEGGKDVFVHISAVERSGLRYLVEGQRLEFQVVQDARGKTAARDLKPFPVVTADDASSPTVSPLLPD